ncbi:hypothetical protein N9L18_00210 [Candidatus Pacebacteria bacterium]|nr:hypothetical protein [Candidatus Paceibacterota bacterium]
MTDELPKKEDAQANNLEKPVDPGTPSPAPSENKEIKKEDKEKEEKKEESKNTGGRGGEVVLERIRTYQDTVKEALRSQSMSSAKVLMAEQKRRDDRKIDTENESFETPRNKIFVGITIALIALALAILIFTLIANTGEDDASNGPRSVLRSDVFFDPDGVVELASAQLSRSTISKIQQVLGSPLPKDSIQQVVITKEILEDPDSELKLTKTVSYDTNDIMALIEARAPESLRKSLDRNYFLGVRVDNDNKPFLLFKINNFNNVFAGMFQWENTLVKDMESIFFRTLSVLNEPDASSVFVQPTTSLTNASSTTASSSEPAPALFETPQRARFNTRKFDDEVIGNTDARVVKNQNGYSVFFYTFIDDDYLFFGVDDETFIKVRREIRSARLVL